MITYSDQSEVVTVSTLDKNSKVKSQIFEFRNDETSSGEIRKVSILVVYTWIEIFEPGRGAYISDLQVTTIKQ